MRNVLLAPIAMTSNLVSYFLRLFGKRATTCEISLKSPSARGSSTSPQARVQFSPKKSHLFYEINRMRGNSTSPQPRVQFSLKKSHLFYEIDRIRGNSTPPLEPTSQHLGRGAVAHGNLSESVHNATNRPADAPQTTL